MKGRLLLLLLVGMRKKHHSSMEVLRKGYVFVISGIEAGVGARSNNDKDNGYASKQASKNYPIL